MAPDLNSLPPSRSPSSAMSRAISNSGESTALRSQSSSPASRTAPNSLQAAATVNAGLQQEDSRVRRSPSNSASRNRQPSHTSRRRSTVLINLQLNDPSMPSPGEMISEGPSASYRTTSPQSLTASPLISGGDPHHNRAPSLGEIHQELEQENEAQVNRLLQQIRIQQQQLQQLQVASGQAQNTPTVIDESTPISERSMSFSNPTTTAPQSHASISTPRSPSTIIHPRSSFDVARADLVQRQSRTSSRTASPRLRSTSIGAESTEPFSLASRDESAFYQAETQTMIRENQMLRQRIRELERQVADLHANSSITHEPATPSHLLSSTSVSEESQQGISGTASDPSSGPSTEVKNE